MRTIHLDKLLICIKSDNVSLRGGAEIKPGQKYHIPPSELGRPSNVIVKGPQSLMEKDPISPLFRIHQGDNLIGFFSEENIKIYFQPIEEHRNNIIDKILQ